MAATPMVSQYKEIKDKYRDAILFYRLGDFYEMFYDDAELASRELGLTLTGRGQDENRMPMCGIPYHAAQSYIPKLLEKGYKVAICEQVEDPKTAKGVVKREVVKIYTPGTVIDSSMILEKQNNYLLAVSFENNKFGVSYVDISTGEFKLTELDSIGKVLDEISRINPSEILFSDMFLGEIPPNYAVRVTRYKDKHDRDTAEKKIKEFFKIKSIEAFGLEEFSVGLSAAAYILEYIFENQKTSLLHINKLLPYQNSSFMFIDSQTRRNLELVATARDKSFNGSLLSVIDFCRTNMGSRLLRSWLLMPLKDIDAVNCRFDSVFELFENLPLRANICEKLDKIFDIERLTAKIASSSGNAKDLVALNESLSVLPEIKRSISSCKSKLVSDVKNLPDLDDLKGLISKAIVKDPPFTIREGDIIAEGYDLELDELRKIAKGGKSWIAELENKERLRTGIKSLKVGFNKVFGYYIEVTTSNLSQVPQDYIRKQTLSNCERFITPDLKDQEATILNADEKSKEMEYRIFLEVREKAAEFTKDLQKIASKLGELDVLASLAEVASRNNYVRPELSKSYSLSIKGSRHPVIEKTLGDNKFVPNDAYIDEDTNFLLITGPNMAGKSTYMRQIALISIMAQMGSFVPASSATLPIVDRIFTRIGAMDDIYSGQSTFMVEMVETANILNNATKSSLIILDEIGRGTATFDGMSIAAAVVEYIHDKIGAKTMFATHYHEITQLSNKLKGLKNLNVGVLEKGEEIAFLHKILEGPADKSYGIQVARLAGLPEEVVKRAKEVYSTLEMVENDFSRSKTEKKSKIYKEKSGNDQVSLF